MRKFTGILAQPMPTALPSDQVVMRSERRNQLIAQRKLREQALLEHFGQSSSDASAWRLVALSLAELVVPAYKPPKGKPRDYRIDEIGWALLFISARRSGDISEDKAFELVAERSGVQASTVRRRLREYQKKYPDDWADLHDRFLTMTETWTKASVDDLALSHVRISPAHEFDRINELRKLEGRAPLLWSSDE